MTYRGLTVVTGALLTMATGSGGESGSDAAAGGINGVPAEILTAVPHGVIVEVQQEIEEGATAQGAKVTIDGHAFEVEVAADGTDIEVEGDDDSSSSSDDDDSSSSSDDDSSSDDNADSGD